jgi:short-subunit dehydrogenase
MGFMSAEDVAKIGYEGFLKGRRVVIPGLMNKLGVHSVRFAPRSVTAQIARMLQET